MSTPTSVNPHIEETWKIVLEDQFNSSYFIALKQFLIEEKKKYIVFPPGNQIFSSFNRTPFDKIKAVIIGQDPYHGPGQAMGLCFSVNKDIAKPPSLVNIFKELNTDLSIPVPETGNLEPWAKQGVLMLNATLTVRAGVAGSHHGKGWEVFTDAVIREISMRKTAVVFLLWGRYAQTKEVLIDKTKHLILKAAHPSPLAGGAFFGCRHFSKTNDYLRENGQTEIDWRL